MDENTRIESYEHRYASSEVCMWMSLAKLLVGDKRSNLFDATKDGLKFQNFVKRSGTPHILRCTQITVN